MFLHNRRTAPAFFGQRKLYKCILVSYRLSGGYGKVRKDHPHNTPNPTQHTPGKLCDDITGISKSDRPALLECFRVIAAGGEHVQMDHDVASFVLHKPQHLAYR